MRKGHHRDNYKGQKVVLLDAIGGEDWTRSAAAQLGWVWNDALRVWLPERVPLGRNGPSRKKWTRAASRQEAQGFQGHGELGPMRQPRRLNLKLLLKLDLLKSNLTLIRNA